METPSETMRSLPAGWLTAVAVAVVVAVNVAGILGIAAARRGVRDEAARLFRVQTEARARAIESGLSATRADLAFLVGSSAIARLGAARSGGGAGEREWSRLATEAALLVFLRGHPEVRRLAVLAGKNDALVEAARRGGVPVLWRAGEAAGAAAGGAVPPDAEGARAERGVRGVFAHGGGGDAVRVVAEIEPRALLDLGGVASEGLSCSLADGAGGRLSSGRSPAPAADRLAADAPLRADGWSAPSPWTLACAQRGGFDASFEPVAARGRRALALNLVVMTLSVVLGLFAVQQARRRERLEARAREEQRVRELERQLFHAERLVTVGRLAAGLAHELNNPLEGMANYLALAREHLAAGDVAAVRDDLDLVREGVERSAGIVHHVLAQANPAADTPAGPVEMGAVVRQTVDFVRSRPEFRGIAFAVEVPEDPLIVEGRPVMLGQVLLNLLRNACEAQPGGGEVQVRVGREGGEVRVDIADRGPGIPEADRPRIFEAFYSTKKSTGLGLSVCDAIARQHRGRIEVQGRPGGGSLFTLSLPGSGAAPA